MDDISVSEVEVVGVVGKVELLMEWLLIMESGLGKFRFDNGERVRDYSNNDRSYMRIIFGYKTIWQRKQSLIYHMYYATVLF